MKNVDDMTGNELLEQALELWDEKNTGSAWRKMFDENFAVLEQWKRAARRLDPYTFGVRRFKLYGHMTIEQIEKELGSKQFDQMCLGGLLNSIVGVK